MPLYRRRDRQAAACQQCEADGARERETAKFLLNEVYLSPELSRNIMSHDKLDRKGFNLSSDGDSPVLARHSNGQVAFDVSKDYNMLYVQKVR